MTPQEIEQRLAQLNELKIHPRDRIENRTLVAQADRLYEQLLGLERDYLAQQVAVFQSVLERQNPIESRRARETLQQVMRQLDGGFRL